MITATTLEGKILRDKYAEEIENAIRECLELRKKNCSLKSNLTNEDFCVFVHENGYAVMLNEQYSKLSKRVKNKIEKDYCYRQHV